VSEVTHQCSFTIGFFVHHQVGYFLIIFAKNEILARNLA